MKTFASLAAAALLVMSTAACTSGAAGPDAAYNRGGKTTTSGKTLWRATAQCSVTGARGRATRQSSAADAAAAAVASCIRRGGIPACCSVRELKPYNA